MNSTEDLFSISWALNGYYTIPVKGIIDFVTNLICLLVILYFYRNLSLRVP